MMVGSRLLRDTSPTAPAPGPVVPAPVPVVPVVPAPGPVVPPPVPVVPAPVPFVPAPVPFVPVVPSPVPVVPSPVPVVPAPVPVVPAPGPVVPVRVPVVPAPAPVPVPVPVPVPAPVPAPAPVPVARYRKAQGWCRPREGRWDPPFLWDVAGSVNTQDECEAACDENEWCDGYGWGPGKAPSERCRLHGNDAAALPFLDGFRGRGGGTTGCADWGDGNSSTWCYIKNDKKC